ncbi:MAG TPA: hypothetical protein VF538_17475 [Pyrinomonadaceae bacterium]|jgi:hypothetical protein
MQFQTNPRRACARRLARSALLVIALTGCASPQTKTQPPSPSPAPTPRAAQTPPPQPAAGAAARPQTPTETVRAFYAALRERRLRDAFALSIYKAAVDPLSAEEFEELRPEFEKLGEAVPEKIEINGEQISGERATVFARVSAEAGAQPEPVDLIRVGGAWVVGSAENYDAVRREGKEFFFKARVETHHAELRKVLDKIANAEAVYASQNGGRYAELTALAQSEMGMRLALREDADAVAAMGYRLTLNVAPDARSYKVNAEPARYGRTGRLSYYMDATSRQEKDNGGKPFNPPPAKKKS